MLLQAERCSTNTVAGKGEPPCRLQAPCTASSAQRPNRDGLRAEHQGRDVAATLVLSTEEVGW